MSNSPEHKVFLSYSSQDREYAERIVGDLVSAGVDIWFDKAALKAGDPIYSTIRSAIAEANYLIVLISSNSISSTWVDREIREAFRRQCEEGSSIIIPVRIDDTPVPKFLEDMVYVDLRGNYAEGFASILRSIKDNSGGGRVADFIDPSDLASGLAVGRKAPRGLGFYVTTTLSIITIAVTLIAAWPSFYQVLGDRSKVYYSVSKNQMSIPSSLDHERIRKILKEENLPDSNLRISLVNRGSREANEIKIGVEVEGELVHFSSAPDAASNPVWVTIVPPTIDSQSSTANLYLNGLAPSREFRSNFSYFGNGDQYSCDVVVDGIFAEEVDNVSDTPQLSVWRALQTPFLILLVGIVASIIAGAIAASLKNKRFRVLAVDLLSAVSPLVGRILFAITK